MKTLFNTILFFVILLTFPGTRALSEPKRDIRFDRINAEHGLSNDSVWGIAQDTKGFMWFGTFDGLNRYDGHSFKVYRSDPDDPGSLSENAIRGLCADHTGVLWIGTWGGGLNLFDRETETFIHYKHRPDDPHSLSNNAIRTIYEDRPGTIWIGTMNGLNRFDREKKHFIRYQHDPEDQHSLANSTVWAVCEDRSDVLWVGTENGLSRMNRETGKFTSFRSNPEAPSTLSHNSVRSICEDSAGSLWVGTMKGVNRFDRKTSQFTRYQHNPGDPGSLSHNLIFLVHEDQAGIIWVGTWGGGLNQFDPETETFVHHTYNPGDPASLGNDNAFLFYEDRAGTAWIATDGGGISILDRNRKAFHHFRNIHGNANSLSHNAVRSLCEDRGTLWIGTNSGGLNKFERDTGRFTHYRNDVNDQTSLATDSVWTVHEDREGFLWVGGLGGVGLNKFNPETEIFTLYSNDPADSGTLSHNSVFTVYEDRAGILWIGTWGGGINRFDRETGRFTRYQNDPDNPGSLSHNQILKIHEDRAGILWVGTMGGLSRFDRKTEQFTSYFHDPDDSASLGNNLVASIHEDSGGSLWFGTVGGGLNKLSPGHGREKGQFIHYTDKHGLASNTVWGILEDDEGNLWLSTTRGLSRFNPLTETFRNYDAIDGLQGNSFLAGAYHKSPGGEMFFGGTNGFNAFYPDQITDNPFIPPVVITDFHLANKPVPIGKDSVLKKSITETGHLTLTYRDQVFSFEFAALNYQSPGKNRYKYKLEGFEKDWNEVDSTRRYATYTNLDSGEYTFLVTGSNNDGLWNKEGAAVRIRIHPPWWATWEFRITVGLILVFSGVTLFKWRMKAVHGERFRKIFFNHSVPMLLIDPEAGTISEANPAASEFYGYTPDEFKGLNIKQINRLTREQISDTTRKIRTRQKNSFVFTHYLKNGEARTVEVRSASVELRGREFLFSIVHDISERIRAEEALRRSESNNRALLRAIPDIIFHLTEQGDFLQVYGAREDLYAEPERIIGNNVKNLLPQDIRDITMNCIRKTLNTGVLQNFEYQMPLHGGISDFEARMVPVGQDEVIALIRNITEIRKTEAALIKAKDAAEVASKAKSTFLANMSHELRTPLNGILGFAQILKNDLSLTDEQQQGIRVIEQSGEHLLALLNDILDLAKIESGKIELHKTVFHFPDFIREVCDSIRVRAEKKKIAFILDDSQDSDDARIPAYVRGDERRLRQILINLLGNAIKFTDRGSITLRIKSLIQAGTGLCPLTFEVEDTGVGIAPEDLQQVFDSFQQAGEQKYQEQGTGLGLAVSRNLAELMGGKLEAFTKQKSQIPNKSQTPTTESGSIFRFHITLPEALYEKEKSHEKKRDIIGFRGKKRKILVVDDMLFNRELFSILLAPLGFEVTEASGGEEGLEKAHAVAPDLIIADILMPGMDGLELIRRIRQSSVLKDKAVIASSASVYPEDQQNCSEAGADGFLPKPVKAENLLDLLGRLMDIDWVYAAVRQGSPAAVRQGSPTAVRQGSPDAVRQGSPDAVRQGSPTTVRQGSPDALSPDRFGKLSDALIRNLTAAAKQTDPGAAENIIEDIREIDEVLAESLYELVEEFRFDILQEILKEIRR
ncbi:two-component regulator propeller domain-containing protein [Desulfococcaceae bacterium HSG8]|nr:two-component regulator propeller domain-containing protein [Desulfococcaceae bacterium HSG8]